MSEPTTTTSEEVQGLGPRLRAARALRGVSQEQLATASGVSSVSIGAIERGGDTRLSTLARLAAALELEPHELLTLGT